MIIDEEHNLWYSSLISDALECKLKVSLFITNEGTLGVKIDDVEFPYFAWESFEDIIDGDEALKKARMIIKKYKGCEQGK